MQPPRLFTYLAAFTALLFALTAVPCGAATFVVDVTIDVTDITPGQNGFTGGAQGSPPFGAPFDVVLDVGDTFDFTIDFAGSETLTIENLFYIWAFSYADTTTEVTGTGSLSLLDTAGLPLYTSITKTTTDGDAHFGQTFFANDFVSLPSSVTFGGLRYVGTVDAYAEPDATPRHYNDPGLYFQADSFVPSVPEPSTGVLIFAGLGLLAARAQRRTSLV